MNFRHLNEAFNRLNEKALNEGPGAGYTIKGTTIIKVDNVKVLSKEDNEYDTTYEVSFNGRGTADIEFASYYYGDSLEDVPVVATKAYVDVDTDDINNGYTVEQYIESLFYNEELKIDLIYGGGWSHSTYDGTVASEEYPAENTYVDIVITDMKITDEDIIQYIDAVVQGEFENDDYFEESLSDDRISGNLNLLEENKSFDRMYNNIISEEFNNDELIKSAIKGDTSAIKLLRNKGYTVKELTNPLQSFEVGTFEVVDNTTGEKYNYDNTLSHYSQIKSAADFEESLSDDIRKGNLDYNDEIDAHYKKNGNIEVQFQDRTSNMHIQKNPKDRFSKFEKQPRVSSHTWGRIWKDGNLVKSVEDSKYGARQEIAKYLDDNSMGESLEEPEDITYTPKVRRFMSVDGRHRIINQYYEEPNYPYWGKAERNVKEISDDEYDRFQQTGKLEEDTSKEWKPNTSFAHIKKIYNDVKKRGYKYVNNELEEMHAAMKKVDAKGYTPEQRKQIRSWSEEIWRANRKNESLTKEESEDARKFIRKFCNGQWSDDYVNLIIYVMGEVVMADYREDIEDACSEILKSNSENAWVVIEEKLSASDLFKYCYEEFYDDLSTVCGNILNGQSVDRAISSYLSTGYNRDKFVQVVRDIISRIDFEYDFDLDEEIDSALIYDEDLWSVIEFYLDPDDIINGNGFDIYMSFVNDVEDIMLEYYSTEDKNESLNEEESPESISDNDNSYSLAFVPTADVKSEDFTNVLCDILNKAGIKNCCAKKRGGNYGITVICPSNELGTAKTIIENCGFFKEWLPLNNRGKNESLKEERGNYGHKGPFWYYSKHGMGPGTLPKDVKVVDWYEDDDYNTWVALDNVLTTQELREYELKEQKPPIKDR